MYFLSIYSYIFHCGNQLLALSSLFYWSYNTITQKQEKKIFRCVEGIHLYKILKTFDNSKNRTFSSKYFIDLKTNKAK